jgi:outer membrane protein, multidrug efflux system
MKTFSVRLLILSAIVILSSCASVGHDYRQPETQLPLNWQSPQNGKLTDLNVWWSSFNDPALNTLLEAAQKDNPSLSKAVAAIEKSRANSASVNANFLPRVDAAAVGTSSGSFMNGEPYGSISGHTSSAQLDSSWEIDLFGKNRRSAESAAAQVQAREADWHDARVSLASEVAARYIDYRACRLKQKYYDEQAESQSKTSDLTMLMANAGFTAPADARLAEASAANIRSTALGQKTECEVLVKTLVALTGMTDSSVHQTLGQDAVSLPQTEGLSVSSVPADLLRQRPDLVSAERSLASASALIGVAEAGHYPSFSLTGNVALQVASGTTTAPWSFGPTLSLPIFSGGRVKAAVKSARADFDSALASYKQVVRDAVKEVEQSLVRLDTIAQREQETGKSAEGYRTYLAATEQSWRVGRTSLIDLETARRLSINAEISLLELQQNRLQYWIALYKAVGGGWNVEKEK